MSESKVPSYLRTPEDLAKIRAENKGKRVYQARAHVRSIQWTLEQFRRATGPLVYVWWGVDPAGGLRRAIYVGKSSNGLTRPLDPAHHRKNARNYLTDVEFICCATDADAIELEAKLIRQLDPIENEVRPGPKGKGTVPYTSKYRKC